MNLIEQATKLGWYVFPVLPHGGVVFSRLAVRPNLPDRDGVMISMDGSNLHPEGGLGVILSGQEAVDFLSTQVIPHGPALALAYVERYGSIDGGHHKQWVLDQVARALTDCPRVVNTDTECYPGYKSFSQGESEQYKAWVYGQRGDYDEEYDEFEYEYDTGIAP